MTSQNGLFIDKYWQVYIGFSTSVKNHVQDITVRVSRPGVPYIAPPFFIDTYWQVYIGYSMSVNITSRILQSGYHVQGSPTVEPY